MVVVRAYCRLFTCLLSQPWMVFSTSVWCANIGLNCLYLPLSAQRELLNHSQSGYCPTMVH